MQLPPMLPLPPSPSRAQMEIKERELKTAFTTPLSGWYIVGSIALGLLLIVGLVLVYGFHLF